MNEEIILIVDDEPVIRNIFSKILSTNSQYKIIEATNGREALEICREEKPDLIFTDIKMPVMDGMEFLSELRGIEPDVPVVIVSAHGKMEDIIKALRLGASNFLMKPNDISILHSIAEKLLRVRKKEKLEKFVYSYFKKVSEHYAIPSQVEVAIPLIDIVSEKIEKLHLLDDSTLKNIRIALDEAITNAIVHGNLELSSESKGKSLEELVNFNKLLKKRSLEDPYDLRKVNFHYKINLERIEFSITDEGKGFDWKQIPISFENIDVFSSHGRGLILIHTFMDKVEFNETGNQITLIKNLKPSS